MPMDTQSASAITRTARKLKSLADNVPSTEEIHQRRCAELADARARLDAIVKRQLAIEAKQSRSPNDLASILAEKAVANAEISRLSSETSVLKQALIAQKPAPELTPAQKVRATMFAPPADNSKVGTAEELRVAREAYNELVREAVIAKATGSAKAAESLEAKATAARLRVAWSAMRIVFSKRDRLAEYKLRAVLAAGGKITSGTTIPPMRQATTAESQCIFDAEALMLEDRRKRENASNAKTPD